MRSSREGISLLEASLGIAIGGSLLAIAVPTFVRTLHVSKTNEAAEQLAELHRRASTYFAAGHDGSGLVRRWCLPEEAGPTPRFPSAQPVDFAFDAETTQGHETWKALGFQPQRIRYRYSFVPESTGCGIRRAEHVSVVTYVAEGDLDEDGELSTFERSDSITEDGLLVPEGALRARAPIE